MSRERGDFVRLKELRKKKGISQLRLATDLHTTQNTVSRYETGEREPGIDELIKIAGRYDNAFTRIISAPGVWLQKITTKEPTDDMIECAIAAMEKVIPEDKEKDKKTDELSEIKKEIERLKQAEQDKHKND